MSETSTEEPILDSQGSQVVDLPQQGDLAFGALMDALAPEPEASAEAGDQADAATAAAGAAGAGGAEGGSAEAGAGAATGTSVGAADGTAGVDGAATADAAAGGGVDGAATADAAAGGEGSDVSGGGRPDSWTQPAAELVPRFGELSTKFEENISRAYHETALAEVREEHTNYFEALEKHPRMLVGTEVPAIGREGMEVIRDTADAREWQEAVKQILVEEVKGKAQKELDDNSDFLATVHSSIELFQNNTDLIPSTKDFDVELANRFAEFATPYELRVEGKLQGYSIPVQPLIDQIRAQLVKERAAGAAASTATKAGTTAKPAATAAGAPAAKAPAKPAEQPQAGIQSKAGSSESTEDFSTLFGTLGLPNLQI